MRSDLGKKGLLAIAAVAACNAMPAWADDAQRLADLERKLEASLKTIDALQKRLDQVERKAPATAAADSGWGARLEAVERNVAQLGSASASAAQVDTGLPIHGFADIVGGMRNNAAAGTAPRGFSMGVMDLYMTPQISAQVKGLLEVAFEYDGTGALAVDVERMQLGYVFSDALTMWAGRFHTPYGYWNTAFHHGAQIQTALSRPRFLEFEDEGAILPAHSIGLWATGSMRTGLGKFEYDAYVTNGNRIASGVLDFQPTGAQTGSVAVGFKASLAPAGTGLTVGIHGLRQRVGGDNANATASGEVRMGMWGAFATFDNDDWEGMAEYYRFSNRDLSGGSGTHSSNAWYLQLGRNLSDRWTVYGRLERASLDAADPYFALLESGKGYKRSVAGLRYNVTPKSAVKAEWMQTTQDDMAGKPASIALQYSVRF